MARSVRVKAFRNFVECLRGSTVNLTVFGYRRDAVRLTALSLTIAREGADPTPRTTFRSAATERDFPHRISRGWIAPIPTYRPARAPGSTPGGSPPSPANCSRLLR